MERQTYNFASDFEDLVIACMIGHPDRFIGYVGVIEPGHFNGMHAFLCVQALTDYYQKYSHYPTWQVLGQLTQQMARKMGEAEKGAELALYIQKLSAMDTKDVEYIAEQTVNFAREKAVLNAARKLVDMVREGKNPENGAVKLFEDALKIGSNLENLGYVYHRDIDVVLDLLERQDYGVPTGYPLFDELWKGGWAPGWLIVPLAPPKRYKTAFCINLALNMVGPVIHQDVFYFACEISQELACFRAMMRHSQLTKENFYQNPVEFRRAVHEGVQIKVGGNLVVKSFPSKTATIQDIKAHAKLLMSTYGYKPKAIIVDYAETIKPSNAKGVSDWRQQSDIYTEARAMGSELGCCVIMPDRCTKEACDSIVPDMKAFQGAFEKAGIVDIAIGLCCTEAEYANGQIRFFTFIDRHNEGHRYFRGTVDASRMTVEITEKLVYVPDQDKELKHGRWSGHMSKRNNRRGDIPPDLKNEEE